MKEESYGELVKGLRLKMNMTQGQVATALHVTPGYISNIENNRTAVSLRMLIYYARLMDVSLDYLVGSLEPEYKMTALDHDIMVRISKMKEDEKAKLLKTLDIWTEK